MWLLMKLRLVWMSRSEVVEKGVFDGQTAVRAKGGGDLREARFAWAGRSGVIGQSPIVEPHSTGS